MSAKPAARLSDANSCPVPGHGVNPVVTGSPNVLINNLPAARIGDTTGCGDSVSVGIPSILVNGRPIAFLGSATAHGGVIISGSGDVLVGNQGGGASFKPVSYLAQLAQAFTWISFDLADQNGKPYAGEPYVLTAADKSIHEGRLDANGVARVSGIRRGACSVRFPRLGISQSIE